MMDYLDHQQIRSLLENSASPAVSIYMPTHRGGAEAKQDPIRLKNAIVEAKQRLVSRGWSERQSDLFLAPCRELLGDGSFWLNLADGLAAFLDKGGFRYYRLPFHFDDMVAVADTFFIKPLIPFLNRSGEFYLLALSEQQVRLFRGSGYGIRELELTGVPRSMKEAFQYDEPEQQQQWHTRTSQAGMPKAAMRQAMFHGHGGAVDIAKTDRDRFIHLVDRKLNRILTDKNIPLVLASVDYSLATYASINSYPRLLDRHVQGNPDHLEEQELWRRAWPVVEPELLKGRSEALKRGQEQAHSDRGGNSFEKVTPHAYEGRVDELVVAVDREQYGTYDPATRRVVLHDEPGPDNIELLEFTAHHTLLNGGSVYAMNSREVPGGAWLLATFRY
jgi:hypothetical protein